VIGQHRSSQRYGKRGRDDEEALTDAVIDLARTYGRYGYRRVWGLLSLQGWQVSLGRVERIWRREGLKVANRQPKRGRLWLNDGSCIRLRPSWRHHVWSYDFVQDRTDDGKPFRMLVVIDEFSRECLAIVVARRLRSDEGLSEISCVGHDDASGGDIAWHDERSLLLLTIFWTSFWRVGILRRFSARTVCSTI
jgi:transposase InsO family protein